MKKICICEEDFNKARKKIRENKEKKIIFSGNDNINKDILKKEKISVLLINQKGRKDCNKERNSGLNQVLAKLAKMNNVKIGINLDELIDSEKKERAKIISRIKQNIKICNKNGIYMEFVSLKYEKDLILKKGLGSILGMPTWMTKGLE